MRGGMRRMALACVAALVLAACGGSSSDEAQRKEVRAMANRSYAHLVAGDLDGYLQCIHDYDSLLPEFQTQLRDLFAQYLDQEQRLRGGLMGHRVVGDTLLDSLSATAFVEVSFGDSTREVVSLPLVRSHGRWMLR